MVEEEPASFVVVTIWSPEQVMKFMQQVPTPRQLRTILRLASLRRWECLSLDVKSAFLLAPKAQGETVIVRPPKILEEAKLTQTWRTLAGHFGHVRFGYLSKRLEFFSGLGAREDGGFC